MLRYTGGVQVTLGQDTTWGHHVETDEPILGPQGEVIAAGPMVLVATGRLPDLVEGSYPVVDGIRWRVRRLQRENDGLETRAFLTRVQS